MDNIIRELDFSWSLLDSGLTNHFKYHKKKTSRTLIHKPSEHDVNQAFEELYFQIQRYYPELKGKKYQWMITDIGVFLRVIGN
ncbi:TPA: hypothetical protein I7678_21580 [Vibrio vulnificus]|nr:hypothetical protein CRN39_14060 [Vibrio vulnificus]HAS8151821.1 hypothetical protein [Vibrio vulnificus]HAS8313199.1 hypothetical protein [Vibrio vulnificus]HAS8556460.1 hypothetical protein [Vibrio vulnificus]